MALISISSSSKSSRSSAEHWNQFNPISQVLDLTWIIVSHEVEPLFPHLHPGDAFSRQVRVDGREFTTEASVLDDPPCSQCHWSCFFQMQTCRRYQSSSSATKNSTLRPQELLSSSFCRRESADRGKQWVTTSSRPSSFGKQSIHWLLEAKQTFVETFVWWRHDIDNILALRNISMKSLHSKKYKSTFHPKSWFHPDACEWSSDGCCNHLRELVSYHKQGDWDISGFWVIHTPSRSPCHWKMFFLLQAAGSSRAVNPPRFGNTSWLIPCPPPLPTLCHFHTFWPFKLAAVSKYVKLQSKENIFNRKHLFFSPFNDHHFKSSI